MKTSKSVSFSPTSQLCFIPRSTPKQNAKKWYSSQERDQFKRMLAYNIAQCSAMLSLRTRCSKPPSEDEMIQCLGIESMLTRGIAEHVMQTKRNHWNKILHEQARQRHYNSYDQVALACLSYTSSQESRVRSYKIAVRLMNSMPK
jgi:hypothetical protein